jgi:hypothetical protein
MAKQTLTEWITEARNDGDPKLGGLQDKPCSHIALVHLAGGMGLGASQKEIAVVKFNGQRTWSNEELAKMFNSRAVNFSQDATSVQYFALLAFYGEDVEKNTHPFVVNVNAANSGFFGEGADDKGERQQAMRHKEMVFQQMLSQQHHLNNHYERALKNASDEIAETKRENRDMFTIMKEMILEKSSNDHENAMKQLAYQRSTDQTNKLIKLIPPLANTITGRNVFPQETADSAILNMIAEAMDEGGLEKLMSSGIVKPEMMGPLIHRLQQHLQKKREEAEELAKLRPPPGDPHADAGGGEGSGMVRVTPNGTGKAS